MYMVEGNIGAGKSTFLKLIQEHLAQVSVVFEPIQNWQSQVHGQSLLANFYEDPHRWAYTMETLAMTCRVQEHLKEQKNANPLRIMERSIYSGHYIFAINDYQSGFLSDIEWEIYLAWFNFLVNGHCQPPHGFIYLKVEPEIAYERIRKRNRLAEKSISLDYIKQIHACHENFLAHKIDVLPSLLSVPVLTLDCNEEFETDSVQFAAHAQAVADFMQINNYFRGSVFASTTIAQ